jgi:hypothetical protein
VGAKYRDGIHVLNFHSWLHDNRVNVSFEYEPFGDPELDGHFREACVYMGDKVDGVSHPMTSARRAAGRVNASLVLYREAMERCMERRRKHEELLAIAPASCATTLCTLTRPAARRTPSTSRPETSTQAPDDRGLYDSARRSVG